MSDLHQWTYCPRVVWWTHVCPVGKYQSYKMRHGLAKEQRLQQLQKRRSLHRFRLRQGRVQCNVNLCSASLGLSGRLDMLIVRGLLRQPVEIKFTTGPARLNHRIQLAGQALLLEDQTGIPVSHGYIVRLPDDTVERVEIDQPLRELTCRTILALRHMLTSESMPPPNPVLARCCDCEYLRFCGDIE